MTLELSRNQKMVHQLLEKSDKPMKAYRILFEIQKKGVKSPTQVYRALDKLMEIGKVHKIESRNSYIACNNRDCLNQLSTSFLICNVCEKIVEIELDQNETDLLATSAAGVKATNDLLIDMDLF